MESSANAATSTSHFSHLDSASLTRILSHLPPKSVARLTCSRCVKSILSVPWSPSPWHCAASDQCGGVYVERLHPKHLECHAQIGTVCYCLCNGIYLDSGRHLLRMNPSNAAITVSVSASKTMSSLTMKNGLCVKKGKRVVECPDSNFKLAHYLDASYSEFRLYGGTRVRLSPGKFSVSWRIASGKALPMSSSTDPGQKRGYLGSPEPLRQAWPLTSSVGCPSGNQVCRFLFNPSKVAKFPLWTDVQVAEIQILRVKFNELVPVELDFSLSTCDQGWKSPTLVESLVIQQIS